MKFHIFNLIVSKDLLEAKRTNTTKRRLHFYVVRSNGFFHNLFRGNIFWIGRRKHQRAIANLKTTDKTPSLPERGFEGKMRSQKCSLWQARLLRVLRCFMKIGFQGDGASNIATWRLSMNRLYNFKF